MTQKAISANGSADLTTRQIIFAIEYAASGNGQAAAEAAGYAPKHARKHASRLLTVGTVRTRIEYLKNRHGAEIAYDAKQWVRDLMGDITEAKEAGSHSAVMKGRELLGRHIGAFADSGRLNKEEAALFAWLGAAAARAGWGVEGIQESRPATRQAVVTIDAAGSAPGG